MDAYHTADALAKIIALAQRSNKYIDETTPWSLAKDEASLPRLKTVLSNLIEAIRYIGILSEPFMPDTAASISARSVQKMADWIRWKTLVLLLHARSALHRHCLPVLTKRQ